MKEDLLTGLFERAELFPYLDKLTSQANHFTLGLIDLNNFKKINDKYGHLFGDGVLKYVSSTIKLTLADRAVVFRYGGDEFIVVFPDYDKKYGRILFKLCNRNLKKRPFLSGSKLLKITVSYGLASYPLDALDTNDLISKADMAMYCSKKIGRGAISDIAKIKLLRYSILARKILLALLALAALIYGALKIKQLVIKKISTKTEVGVAVETSEEIPGYPCEVIFKNGAVLKGKLLEKSNESITIEITMGQNIGSMKIDKKLISKIRTYKNVK